MIIYTYRFDKALNVAARCHGKLGETRKFSDVPFIVHPVGAAIIASSITEDEDILIACLLHDVLENVQTKDPSIYNESKMKADFGGRVTQIVKDVSKDESIDDWHEKAEKYLNHLENRALEESLTVCAADKIHNLMSIVKNYQFEGDKVWQRFGSNSKNDQFWWYESTVDILKKRNADKALVMRIEEQLAELK